MTLTTASSRLEPVESCIAAPFSGRPCYCAGQTIANFCDDGACVLASDGDFVCREGPFDGLCSNERFRRCLSNADCPATGDRCDFSPRSCSGEATLAAGNVAPLLGTGTPDPEHPVLVATFCVPAANNASPNQGLGLPGPAALRLPVRVELTR
jgi:hypothetical protein